MRGGTWPERSAPRDNQPQADPDDVLDAVVRLLAATPFPGPPRGFVHLSRPRPMRAVCAGRLDGNAEKPPTIAIKWHRPTSRVGRWMQRLRGGRGLREHRQLARAAAAGVNVPPVVGSRRHPDVLVTSFLPDLEPLPAADAMTRGGWEALARALAGLEIAGIDARDLHRGNLCLQDGVPVVVDLGRARRSRRAHLRPSRHTLGQHGHALLGNARRSQQLRALEAFARVWYPDRSRVAARAWAREACAATRAIRRRYRRGRDRRILREGLHFGAARGGWCWKDRAAATWLGACLEILPRVATVGRALSSTGRVVAAAPTGQRPFVFKSYRAAARWRLPRAWRAFRLSHQLVHRHIAVAPAWLVSGERGETGTLVSPLVEGRDLFVWLDGAAGPAHFAALPVDVQRRALERLGRTLRAMHDADVSHRDLKPPNLMWDGAEDGGTFTIVDADGAKIHRRSVSLGRRMRDLARLAAGANVAPHHALRVGRAYLDVLPRLAISPRVFLRGVAAHAAQKRGPLGRPR